MMRSHVASAIKTVHEHSSLRLNSFSVSYNPRIQMGGAIALLEVLPSHLTEFGMVGCSLNDELEPAITLFLSRSENLRLICVEKMISLQAIQRFAMRLNICRGVYSLSRALTSQKRLKPLRY